jgi:hypothetical protein
MCSKHDECSESNPLEGKYANHFKVGHNAFEFVLDFGQSYMGDQEPQLHTRIITSPAYAKAFSDTLQKSIVRYDRTFASDIVDPNVEDN